MKRRHLILEILIAIALVVGMFPSLTALSQKLYSQWTILGKYAGPLNPIKAASPLILYWIFLNRSHLKRRFRSILLVGFVLGSIGTVTGGLACEGVPPALLREWFVMLLGTLAALSLFLFRRSLFLGSLSGWVAVIYGSVLLNYLFPSGLNWINAHFFDPIRQVPLHGESLQFLIGFYDVASLGKLLVWIPWIVGFVAWLKWPSQQQKVYWGFLLVASISMALSLATTQRGPFIGMLAGAGMFFAHRFWISPDRRLIIGLVSALSVLIIGVTILVPHDLILRRVTPLFSPTMKIDGSGTHADGAPTEAHQSVLQRKRLMELNLSEISKHPLGKICTPPEEFSKRGIFEAYHTHSLILEQFKVRGWAFGLFHLGLWLLAFVQTWKLRSWAASSVLGGIATTFVLGFADHPWFVLNHAMILGFFLFAWVFADKWQTQGEFK